MYSASMNKCQKQKYIKIEDYVVKTINVKNVAALSEEEKAAYAAAFKKNPGKYKCLQGYMIAKEYKKLVQNQLQFRRRRFAPAVQSLKAKSAWRLPVVRYIPPFYKRCTTILWIILAVGVVYIISKWI